jgi:F0F1-type ATP synthase assembly protein I
VTARRPPVVEALRYAQIGTMLIAPMLVLGGIGYWLDARLGWQPWLLLAGLILGMAAGFLNFFRLVLSPPPGGEKRERGDGEGQSREGGQPPRQGPPGGAAQDR